MLSRLKALRLLKSGPAIEGLDGWYFLSDRYEEEITVSAGLATPDARKVEAAARAIERFGERVRGLGAHFLFAPAPAKPAVYSDKLPPALAPRPEARFATALLRQLEPGMWLDLLPVLQEARRDFETFSRLNSHWSDYGAFVAWQEIEARAVTLGIPAAPQGLSIARVEEIEGFNELDSLMGVAATNNWTFPQFNEYIADIVFELPDGSDSPQLGRRAVQLGDMPISVRNPNAQTPATCLVVGDSSVVSLSPFLCRHFARVRFVRHSYIGAHGEPEAALAQGPVDLVLLINAERYCPQLGAGV